MAKITTYSIRFNCDDPTCDCYWMAKVTNDGIPGPYGWWRIEKRGIFPDSRVGDIFHACPSHLSSVLTYIASGQIDPPRGFSLLIDRT